MRLRVTPAKNQAKRREEHLITLSMHEENVQVEACKWLDGGFQNVVIEMCDFELTPRIVSALQRLSNLKGLTVIETKFRGPQTLLKDVASLKSLESFFYYGHTLPGSLHDLSGLRSLRELRLPKTVDVTDEEFKAVRNFPELSVLEMEQAMTTSKSESVLLSLNHLDRVTLPDRWGRFLDRKGSRLKLAVPERPQFDDTRLGASGMLIDCPGEKLVTNIEWLNQVLTNASFPRPPGTSLRPEDELLLQQQLNLILAAKEQASDGDMQGAQDLLHRSLQPLGWTLDDLGEIRADQSAWFTRVAKHAYRPELVHALTAWEALAELQYEAGDYDAAFQTMLRKTLADWRFYRGRVIPRRSQIAYGIEISSDDYRGMLDPARCAFLCQQASDKHKQLTDVLFAMPGIGRHVVDDPQHDCRPWGNAEDVGICAPAGCVIKSFKGHQNNFVSWTRHYGDRITTRKGRRAHLHYEDQSQSVQFSDKTEWVFVRRRDFPIEVEIVRIDEIYEPNPTALEE